MSYSFAVRAATKADAKAAVDAKFEEIVSQQPIHARDRAAMQANANAVIDLLADDDTKDVVVSCNGYLSWSGVGEFTPDSALIGSCSVSATANHAIRE